MGEERKRIKRAEVSSETRSGRHRAAVNPHARSVSEPDEKPASAKAKASWHGPARGGDAS